METFTAHISENSRRLVNDVLASGFVSEGPVVREFESRLSGQLGMVNPIALNSCTSALHLGLVLAGVEPGDEVILPPQTFVATGHVVLMCGAIPVFADIDPATGNIDPGDAARRVTERTKVIIPVHWSGYPCDLDELNDLANRSGAVVMEDAAHAIGATYRGKAIGSISPYTAFSFQAIKHLTCGDGGALCVSDQDKAKEGFLRRWFGIERDCKPSILGERESDIAFVSYKYHMNDISAAVGIGNLIDFEERLTRRQELGARYRRELDHVAGVTLLECGDDRTHSYWMFTMRVDDRENFVRAVKSRGGNASVVHLRIDRYSVFGGVRELPGMSEFDATQVSIPCHERISDDDASLLIDAIKAGW